MKNGELEDTDMMPFGNKYKGYLMQDVPANYLHWFFCNVQPSNPTAAIVMKYIQSNLDALKMENKDLIWKR